MSTLIINMSGANDCLVSTSVISGLLKTGEECVDVLVADKNSSRAFRFNPAVSSVYIGKVPENRKYDLAIYLSPSPDIVVNADTKRGFGLHPKTNIYYEMLFGTKYTKKNIFQIYFDLAGLTWKGERPNCYYLPKNKMQKDKTGLAISNMNLRFYIADTLNLEQSRLWKIPYKINIYKRMDEINRCSQVVTDDFMTMYLSITLGKFVFFLKALPYNMKLEMFKQGSILKVPSSLIR